MKKTLSKISYSTTLFIAFLMLVLSGCSAHSPMIVENTTNTKKISENTYPAHQNKIFLTKESLPTNTQIEILASIDIGKVWYGNSKEVYESMAIRAREVGADAVVEIKTWTQPSGFSWAAPHGHGTAVKLQDKLILSNLKGEWK